MADNDESGDGPTPPYGHKSERRPEPPPTLVTIDRRVRDTAGQAQTTLDRVDGLRIELRAHLQSQDRVLEGMRQHMNLLIRIVGTDQDERSEIRISERKAAIEVKKTGELAIIDEQKAMAAHRRERTLKILAIVGPIITAALTAWLFGACS